MTVTTLGGIPLVRPGDDVSSLIIHAIDRADLGLRDQDIVVVAQKIVSKSEGRYLDLTTVQPSPPAIELASRTGKDARLVEAILSQSVEVIRAKPGVLIVETRQGVIMANAGIDQSNIEADPDKFRVLLLPEDPDQSARQIKQALDTHFGSDIGVIISDSVGRPWRLGTVGLALGAAGVPALLDLRGAPDLSGRRLEVTEVGFADAVAAAAVLVMGEAAEGCPAALVRGLHWTAPTRPAAALLRPKNEDLFR